MILGRSGAKSSGIWHSRNKSAKRVLVHLSRAVLQFEAFGADISATMRTLGFRSHVLIAVAAAVGLIASLGRPWYAVAPEPAASTYPGSNLADSFERLVSDPGGTTGWDALGGWGTVIAVVAAATAAGALGCLVPAVQGVARELVRYGALACFAIVAWKLLDHPSEGTELRMGAVLAAVAALISCTSGSAAAAAPLRRRRPTGTAYAQR
jgi:hypothetical protein